MKSLWIAPALAVGLTWGLADVEVEPDKENVVASRLAGEWIPDVELTERLAGSTGGLASLSFTSDPEVAARVPEKYEKFLAEKRVYMAGVLKFPGKQHPFLLVENSGNPHVVYFRERDGDPMGDAESFNLMLAPAKQPRNDLLLVGGDFNNQPFRAFQRKERGGEKR